MNVGSLFGYAVEDDPALDLARAQRLHWLRERFSEYLAGGEPVFLRRGGQP